MRVPRPVVFRDAGQDVLLGHGSFVPLESLSVVFCPARLGDLGLREYVVQGPRQKHVRVHVDDAVVMGEFEEAEFCELVDPTWCAGLGDPVCWIEQGNLDYGCAFIGENTTLEFGDVGRDDDEERDVKLRAG